MHFGPSHMKLCCWLQHRETPKLKLKLGNALKISAFHFKEFLSFTTKIFSFISQSPWVLHYTHVFNKHKGDYPNCWRLYQISLFLQSLDTSLAFRLQTGHNWKFYATNINLFCKKRLYIALHWNPRNQQPKIFYPNPYKNHEPYTPMIFFYPKPQTLKSYEIADNTPNNNTTSPSTSLPETIFRGPRVRSDWWEMEGVKASLPQTLVREIKRGLSSVESTCTALASHFSHNHVCFQVCNQLFVQRAMVFFFLASLFFSPRMMFFGWCFLVSQILPWDVNCWFSDLWDSLLRSLMFSDFLDFFIFS